MNSRARCHPYTYTLRELYLLTSCEVRMRDSAFSIKTRSGATLKQTSQSTASSPNHHVSRYRLEGERRRTFKQPSQPALSSDGDGRVCLMCGWGLSTFHPILEYHHIGSRYPPSSPITFSHALSGFRNTKITCQMLGARRKTKTDSVLRLYRSRVQWLDELNTVF